MENFQAGTTASSQAQDLLGTQGCGDSPVTTSEVRPAHDSLGTDEEGNCADASNKQVTNVGKISPGIQILANTGNYTVGKPIFSTPTFQDTREPKLGELSL
ncbi:hypothetical protein D623_10002341 [Myotis brandtii]|uniref:Uncharacterized protein n=1 Tax=Myotis brandtii TaxID=109478 RepID=S7MXV8_MYOBR|nr:hypothetical protein D623_10002341 [Myotis brandtii]